jgi:hypothetical protein
MTRLLVRLSLLLAATAALAASPVVRAAPVFDLVADFSTTQGQNSWSYGFFQTRNFTQASDFKPMILSGDGQGWVPDHSDQSLFPLGENGMWNQGGGDFTLTTIRPNPVPMLLFFHPNSDPSYDFGNLPNSLEMPAVKWTNSLAETAVLNISGQIGNLTGSIDSRMDYGFEINDGYNFLVYRNQTLVKTLAVPRGGFWDGEFGNSNRILASYSFNVSVDPGDALYFVQDPIVSQRSDHGSFSATAVVVPEPTSLGLLSTVVVGLTLAACRRRWGPAAG